MNQPCLDESTLSDFSSGLISGSALEVIEAHLDGCDRCRMIVAGLVRAASDEVAPSHVAVGSSIGRYVVLERVGVGAMGEVFAAYDPQLGRKIALKLLRADVTHPALRSRLLREAQALARLQHPNVVAVYDVSEQGEQLAIAMEYVSGGSTRQWLAAAPRTWSAVAEVFVAAGRGLAAAHAAGLVHRDFKPDNVLVSEAGEARVTDFGLAGGAGHLETVEASLPTTSLATPLSNAGAIVGTPVYMAPDQLEGAAATAASDQFSFCISLAEALSGQRPFGATTMKGLIAQMRAGAPRLSLGAAPMWLRKIVLRGLEADPSKRFSSMNELLLAMTRGAHSKRNRWLAVAAVSASTVAFAGGWAVQARNSAMCTGAEAKLASVWNGQRRGALQAAFANTAVPYAEQTWAAVERAIDAYAEQWQVMHVDACAATRIRGEQTEAEMTSRMACLEGARRELTALLEVFSSPDAKTVERATRATANLRSVAECSNVSSLEVPARDEKTAASVEAVRAQLAKAKALREVGRYAAGLEVAKESEVRASSIGFAPLVAEVQYELGEAQDRSGQFDASIEAFKRSATKALEAKVDRLAAASWAQLAFEVGYRKGQAPAAHDWVELSRAALTRIGGDDTIELHLENNLGTMLSTQGKFAEAAEHYAKSLAIVRRIRPNDLDEVRGLSNWASAVRQSGHPAEALPVLQKALMLHQSLGGTSHPDMASLLNNVGAALGDLGRFQEASTYFRQSLEVRSRLLGAEHPALGTNHLNLGEALFRSGDANGASIEYERAQQIWEKALGPDHPDVISAVVGRAQAALELKHHEVAAKLVQPLLPKLNDPEIDADLVGTAYFTLARALAVTGERPPRSRELAIHAQADFMRAGPQAKSKADEVAAWLAQKE